MSLLPLKGQPVSLALILFELAQPERKRYTKAHSCRIEGVWSSYTYALPCMSIRIAAIVIEVSRSYPGARTPINSRLGA